MSSVKDSQLAALEGERHFGRNPPQDSLQRIIGTSPEITGVKRLIDRAAKSDAYVLIAGESGVGKELVARYIHSLSQRSEGPFVALNCASVPHDLFESEYFGHVRGAFTGAIAYRMGAIRQADRGVLFLDEIGEMAYETQAKLLRVLEDRMVRPVGSDQSYPVNFRLISSTNIDLTKAVEERKFRDDLFYRINILSISIPPLRQRPEDIVELVTYFCEHNFDTRGNALKITPQALELLVRYPWPGNVRELEAAITKAAVSYHDGSGILTPADFKHLSKDKSFAQDVSLKLADVEAQHIQSVLRITRGHRGRAAEILGIDPKTLYSKTVKYGIKDLGLESQLHNQFPVNAGEFVEVIVGREGHIIVQIQGRPLYRAVHEFEIKYVLEVLRQVGGNEYEASNLLKANYNGLKQKLRNWRLLGIIDEMNNFIGFKK